MAGKWRECCWGDLATLEYGKGLRGYESAVGSYRVFGTNGPIGWHSQALCNHPTVIVGRKGAYRGVHYSPAPCFVIDTAFYLSPKTDFDIRWAYYELLTKNINAMDSGSAIPSTSRDDFYNLPVYFPPLSEQKAIAHILGTLDDKIELNQKMNETLEAMARKIFKSWFIDFDPVRAKMEGRNPYGMDSATAALFPDSFVDSPFGKIPKGWKMCKIKDICNIGRGASPRPIQDYLNGEIPWVKIADATSTSGPFIFKTKEKIKTEGANNSVWVNPGDLILSNSATCGMPMFVDLHGCIHDGWLYFKNYKTISKYYLYSLLAILTSHFVQIADGSVQKNLNTQLVGEQIIMVPSINTAQAFDSIASNLFNEILINVRQSNILANIRDTLLPKILSGEIKVKETGFNKILERNNTI